MNELDKLAGELDAIDEKFGEAGRNRSDPSWSVRVNRKDSIAQEIYSIIKHLPNNWPLSAYILSSSYGRQVVAMRLIEFRKDPTYLDLVCYILLNSTSNFLKYYTQRALVEILDQCDYHQITQIRQTLCNYFPPEETSRLQLKQHLLNKLEPKFEFSVDSIMEGTYWWKDVENKFFNSLSGMSQYRLCNIKVIRNRRLVEKFNQCRTQFNKYDKILFVYHGSSSESLRGIAENGFREANTHDSRPDSVAKLDEGYFGRGIYHGFAADYAIHYSECYRNSNEIILSMVLPGRSYIVKKGGEKLGGSCEPGFNSHISPEGKEIILFKSEQILPLFIIQFIHVPNSKIVEEPC